MSYIESSKVFVFPCVSRSMDDDTANLRSKLMSEKNLTNIIKSITDNDSYIISWEGNFLKCIIDGYYFEISDLPISGNKYAKIVYNEQNNELLNGADSADNKFTGLEITATAPEGKYLELCVGGKESKNSYSKFTNQSIGGTIDCGELN